MTITDAIQRQREKIANLQSTFSLRAERLRITRLDSGLMRPTTQRLREHRVILTEIEGELKALRQVLQSMRSACTELERLREMKSNGITAIPSGKAGA